MKSKILKIILVILLLLAIFAVYKYNILMDIDEIETAIESYGVLAPIVFMLLMALAIIISPIPSLPLGAAAGMIWGPALATVYATIGATIGATIAFLIARYLGEGVTKKLVGKYKNFCDQCQTKKMFWIVLGMRLLPVFQFDVVSYGAGITPMKLSHFVLATVIGMIPATFAFAYFGEALFVSPITAIVMTLVFLIFFFATPKIIELVQKRKSAR